MEGAKLWHVALMNLWIIFLFFVSKLNFPKIKQSTQITLWDKKPNSKLKGWDIIQLRRVKMSVYQDDPVGPLCFHITLFFWPSFSPLSVCPLRKKRNNRDDIMIKNLVGTWGGRKKNIDIFQAILTRIFLTPPIRCRHWAATATCHGYVSRPLALTWFANSF